MRYCEGKIHYGSTNDLLDMRVLVYNFDGVINTIDKICYQCTTLWSTARFGFLAPKVTRP